MAFRVLVLCFLLVLSVGVSAKEPTLPLPLSDQLPVELVLNQQEIGVYVPNNAAAAAGMGVIGALVVIGLENAAVQRGENRIGDIRNELLDYRFNDKIEAAIRAKFPSQNLSPHPQISVLPTAWDPIKASQAGEQSRKGILIVIPSYTMFYTFEGLKTSLRVVLVDRERKSNGKMKQRLRLLKTYDSIAVLNKIPGADADENVRRWRAMGKDKLTALLDSAAIELADMVVYDFSKESRADANVGTMHDLTVVGGVTYSGRRTRFEQDWAWVRTGASRYHVANLTAYHPITAPAADAAAPVVGGNTSQ